MYFLFSADSKIPWIFWFILKSIYQITLISEVTDDQKVSSGGGLEEEGEKIKVIEMSIDELKENLEKKELLKINAKNLAGLYWFLAKKSHCL